VSRTKAAKSWARFSQLDFRSDGKEGQRRPLATLWEPARDGTDVSNNGAGCMTSERCETRPRSSGSPRDVSRTVPGAVLRCDELALRRCARRSQSGAAIRITPTITRHPSLRDTAGLSDIRTKTSEATSVRRSGPMPSELLLYVAPPCWTANPCYKPERARGSPASAAGHGRGGQKAGGRSRSAPPGIPGTTARPPRKANRHHTRNQAPAQSATSVTGPQER
jgi:hypothetical protein